MIYFTFLLYLESAPVPPSSLDKSLNTVLQSVVFHWPADRRRE